MLSSFVVTSCAFTIEFLANITICVIGKSSVVGIMAVLELPAGMLEIVITAAPLVTEMVIPGEDPVALIVALLPATVVAVEAVEPQSLHETDVENAFEVSPNCKVMVADVAVPPAVIVHERVLDELAPIVVLELEVGSPLHVKLLGHDNE